MDDPLIYTSNGNVPVASLKYEGRWTDKMKEERTMMFEEFWYDESGAVVKNTCHIYHGKPKRKYVRKPK